MSLQCNEGELARAGGQETASDTAAGSPLRLAIGANAPSVRVASLVAQLWIFELHRQMRAMPDPLAVLAPVEDALSEAAQRGEGLASADVHKLLADLGACRRMCKVQAKRQSREGGLWRELLDLLRKVGR